MRLKNIDLLKGLLIILVIIGHVIQGHVENSIWRTLIYSFHMPLFIGVSGFLLNLDKIVSLNLFGLLKKYFLRIIIPWFIAVFSYFLFYFLQKNNSHFVSELLKDIIYPFYHLWFIPAFLSWIFLTWLLKRAGINDMVMLIIAAGISIIAFAFQKTPSIYESIPLLNAALGLILNTFRPYYYVFFLAGIFYRKMNVGTPKLIEIITPLLLLGLTAYLFFSPNSLLSAINFFLLNLLLLNAALKLANNNMLLRSAPIEWLGINSLGIYLWHVFPILIVQYFIAGLSKFYIITIILELLFLLIYIQLLRISFFKKYVFGMQ